MYKTIPHPSKDQTVSLNCDICNLACSFFSLFLEGLRLRDSNPKIVLNIFHKPVENVSDSFRNLYKRGNLEKISFVMKGGVCTASKKLMDLLNKGIGRELQVSIQYMWQHVLATGIKSVGVEDVFKKIAITEMKHAEAIAERLAYLGGTPTLKPDPIFVGDSLKEMLQNDVKAEEEAIALYKQTIKVADQEGDITTRRLFEEILGEEEEHHDTFTRLLEK